MEKKIYPVQGMHCKSCELLLEEKLQDVPGVEKVKADHAAQAVEIYSADVAPEADTIKAAIQSCGFEMGVAEKASWISKERRDYAALLAGGLVLLFVYALANYSGLLHLGVGSMENVGILTALAVGLVAGVSTCMALVGGLVLSLSARYAASHPQLSAKEKFTPHLYFNAGRVLGFGLLGGLLALLGTALQVSDGALGAVSILIGAVMIFLGLKLVHIFPALEEKNISLPKSFSRLFPCSQGETYSHRGALLSGALTFFLPCGFTQAMQLYAVSSGSFGSGALVMTLFALGTSPGLLGIGGLAAIVRGRKARIFFAAAGLAVIALGWSGIRSGRELMSSGTNAQIEGPTSSLPDAAWLQVQEVRSVQDDNGISPREFTVKRGVKVRWIITSRTQFSCASSVVVKELGIKRRFQKGENIIEFTPTQSGTYVFSCSMGMYAGKIIVVD